MRQLSRLEASVAKFDDGVTIQVSAVDQWPSDIGFSSPASGASSLSAGIQHHAATAGREPKLTDAALGAMRPGTRLLY